MAPLQQLHIDTMLAQFDGQQHLPINLMFSARLNDEQLEQLTQYINTHPTNFASSRVSLYVDNAMLKNKHFQSLLEALKKTTLHKLDLAFSLDELNKNPREMAERLNQYVAVRVNYPVIICEQSSPIKPYNNEQFNPFNTKVITQVQQHNQLILSGDAPSFVIDFQFMKGMYRVIPNAPDKKIKLKALIRPASKKRENIDQYITMEVQHIEVEQQEEVQDVVQDEVIDVAVQEQEQEQGLFDGQLVDFALFQNEPYRSRVSSDNLFNAFKYELFGNMPKAIKFLSHEAAMKIAANAGAFVALNADNLPQNFMLKRTPQGEMVLDYDADADEQTTNVFTPKEIAHYSADELIYDHVDLPESMKAIAAKYGIDPSSKHLDNLWVRYGDEGGRLLFDTLGEPGELSTFIIKQYLNRFPHWDRLLNDHKFRDSLEKIKRYDQAKLTCLKEFLSYTDDTTQFDLDDTLKGFDAFWSEWTILANKNKLDLNKINGTWSHKKVGNPLVYMERLITILRNSRDLSEQLACIDRLDLVLYSYSANTSLSTIECEIGYYQHCALIQKGNDFYVYGNKANGAGWGLTQLDPKIIEAENLHFPVSTKSYGGYWKASEQCIDVRHTKIYQHITAAGAHTTPDQHSLDNYGAYYASKYEGFHVVSKEMGLNYDPDKQNTVAFNSNASLYGETLDALVKYLDARYMASRYSDRSRIDAFTKEQGWAILERVFRFIGQQPKSISIAKFSTGLRAFLPRDALVGFDTINSIVTSLFFVANERYKGDVDVLYLMQIGVPGNQNMVLAMELTRSFMNLFEENIHLSDQEGSSIMRVIKTIRPELDDMYPTRLNEHYQEVYIQQVFIQLQKNKQSVRKALKHLQGRLVTTLDKAEYFMRNDRIETHYYSDLHLFCALLHYNDRKVRRNDLYADQNMADLETFLLKAATDEHPNNLDYAIKAVIQSRHPFDLADLIPALTQIGKLQQFDNSAVEAILTQNKLTLRAAQPAIFSRDSHEVKKAIVQILTAAEMSENGMIIFLPDAYPYTQEIKAVTDALHDFTTLNRLKSLTLTPQNRGNIETQINELNERLNGKSLKALQTRQAQLQQELIKYQPWSEKATELRQLKIKDLQIRLNTAWQKKGILFTYSANKALRRVLEQLKDHVIATPFSALGNSAFVTQLQEKIHKLPCFQSADSFETIDRITNEAAVLAELFNQIIKHNYFMTNELALTSIFAKVDYAVYDYETLYALLDMLANMPLREYADILNSYVTVSKSWSHQEKTKLIKDICSMNANNLPSAYIENYILLAPHIVDKTQRALFLQQIITVFQNDEADPLLKWILTTKTVQVPELLNISSLTQGITKNRAAVHRLFAMMSTGDLKDCLNVATRYPDTRVKIIEILAISYNATPAALLKKDPVDYIKLTTTLAELSVDNLDILYTKLCKSNFAITCLNDGLKNRNQEQPFNDFINALEKAPFGKRDFTDQFETKHVERVVNGFTDLNNTTNNTSTYSYTYRKQMMEAFLFVNRAGNDLPVYNNKPAKDLSNDEITQLFADIKMKKFTHLDPFQTRLYALGLMREAMFRTTGQFPYSTQMIALIDCMMHKGDVMSNIDTGQGKSMIDTMKATLLWLESGRVDLTTASLVDAKRDLDIYCPFWSLLGVRFAKTVITSTNFFDKYDKQGINVSTMAELALMHATAKVEQVDLESEHESLVMNESDYTILDDRTVKRYASTGGPGLIGAGKEWVYDVINQFVNTSDFKEGTTSEAQDIVLLKNYLVNYAKIHKKSFKFIENLPDKKWLMLLESAIIVNYRLKENFDYVLTKTSEPKRINGILRQTRSAKIIMKDHKVSADTQYGNGVQQLLYAKLNTTHGNDIFVIEPESKTIISLNNKNMIDYYRSKKGFIWGSSGTVGCDREIDFQYKQYGFEFSKVEPHQRNIAARNKPNISKDETAQFKHIIQLLQPGKTSNKYMAPALVIFKDIETATRFYTQLKNQYATQAMQLYTGLGHEEQTIHDAGLSGMITITTPALGRNTDIHYDKSVGMNVIETFVASAREDRQKAGRTGRQGSKGNVYYSLNQTDLGEKNIDEVRAILEEKAETERQFNEELYDVLGYLLRHVGKADKAFFKEQWSEFSASVESQYRANKQDGTYNSDRFLQDIVMQFNALSDNQVSVEQLKTIMTQQHAMQKKEALDKKNVALADCISPDIIAYHFVNPTTLELTATYPAEDVQTKLTALFAAVNTKQYTALNTDYITYLNLGGASRSVIRDAHQAFLTTYLGTQVSQSKSTPFYKRWLGFEGHLNKIVNDSNYLLLFKAMVDVRGEKPIEIDIKESIVRLLEEYTQYSWFVSTSKRTAAENLITQIKRKNTTFDHIVGLLSTEMVNVMKSDQNINENSFWRKIKPVNASGDSRLQDTLGRALKLTPLMGFSEIKDGLIQQIAPANANQVTAKRLKSMLEHNRLKKSVDGMEGRNEVTNPPVNKK